MERLATILEVANTEAVPTPMMSTFASLVSLPEIRPQGPPSFGAPLLSTAPSQPMVMPRAPVPTQSRGGNVAFKEYVERTIATMRAPPHEPPVERSRMATPNIPIQTMTLGTGGETQPTLQTKASSNSRGFGRGDNHKTHWASGGYTRRN